MSGPFLGLGTRQDVHHRRPGAKGGFELRGGLHFDDAHPDGADRGVINVPRVLRDDDLIFWKPGQVRNSDVKIGIAARNAGLKKLRS